MSDFTPATRNSAIWSGDSRKVANGKANEVILTKQGKLPIPDLSGIEAVQMGHVFEPVIANLAQNKLKVELTKIEDSLTHKKESWFKSHFDYAGTENGQTILVECKNYGIHQRNKFDDISNTIPNADMAQLVHETAVFGNCSSRPSRSFISSFRCLSATQACSTLWEAVLTLPETSWG